MKGFSLPQEQIDHYLKHKSFRKTAVLYGIKPSTFYRRLAVSGVDTTLDKRKLSGSKRQYQIQSNFFSEIDSPNKAYVLGMLYADGHMYKRRAQVRLKITDLDLLSDIRNVLGYSGPLINSNKASSHHKDIQSLIICNTQLYNDLLKWGCGYDKTYRCYMPKIEERFFGDFFAGFFDGDGCINYSKDFKCGRVTFCSNLVFLGQIQAALTLFNVSSSVRPIAGCDRRIGLLVIKARESVVNFYNLIYGGFSRGLYLKRKYTKYTTYINHIK